MRSILKASAILGGSSAVSLLFAVAVAKASALFLGPTGLGLYALLQSLLALTQLVAGVGLSATLVRYGAEALAAGDDRRFAGLRRGAWLIVAVSFIVVAALMLALRGPLAAVLLGSPLEAPRVAWLIPALAFALAFTVELATLNARHRVRTIATVTVVSSALGALSAIVLFWRLGQAGIAPAVALVPVIQFGVAASAGRGLTRTAARPGWREAAGEARLLVRFGAPYTASALAGAGAQLFLPVLVLWLLDTTAVGLFKASFAFSVSYLGIVLIAMSQDYYPRLCAVRADRVRLTALANQQLRMLLLVGAPVVLCTLALADPLVRLIYSADFTAAVPVLRWQLIGDLFKFGAWSLSFVVLAHAGSGTFLAIELIGGSTLLGLCAAGVSYAGLPGAGIGYTAAYAVYYATVWYVLRRIIGFRWEPSILTMFWAAIAVAVAVRVSPPLRLGGAEISSGILLVLAYAALSLRSAYQSMRAERRSPVVHLPLEGSRP